MSFRGVWTNTNEILFEILQGVPTTTHNSSLHAISFGTIAIAITMAMAEVVYSKIYQKQKPNKVNFISTIKP